MLAVSLALRCFQRQVSDKAVRIRCDNTTVVAYINRQGGTRSGQLCALTWDLLHWCIRYNITLSAIQAYAFPPFSLIASVLAKIEQDDCKVFLVAPFWPRQAWFLRLLRLVIHRPVVLPRRPDILFQPGSNYLHPAPGNLHLTCWVLSHDPSAQRAFRSGLRSWRQAAVDLPLGRSTTADYVISLDGVNSTLIVPPILSV